MKTWLRRLGFARGPLRRRSDRVEIAFLAVIALMVLAVVPIWNTVYDGTVGYSSRLSAERAAHGQLVDAVLTANAPVDLSSGDNGSAGKAQGTAAWTAPDGSPRSGGIPVDPGTRAGTHVPLWTDESGAPVPAPFSPVDIQEQASVLALIAALIWLITVAMLGKGGDALLERHRMAAWGREWARVEPLWRTRQ